MAYDTVTEPGQIWGLQKELDGGRMIEIYEAIKDLPIESIVEVACGYGTVCDGLGWVFKGKSITQFDFMENPIWEHLVIKPYVMDVNEFIKKDVHYDLVIFLNSYRNWDKKNEFKDWLRKNANYFISSEIDGEKIETIGKDAKGHDLQLWKI